MAGTKKMSIRIGLDRPEWMSKEHFIAARIAVGLAIGIALSAYGTALAVALDNLIAGDGARVGELVTLFIGGWVIKETLKRMTLREGRGVLILTAPVFCPADAVDI